MNSNINDTFLSENVFNLNKEFVEMKMSVTRLEERQLSMSGRVDDIYDLLHELKSETIKNNDKILSIRNDVDKLKEKKSFLDKIAELTIKYRMLISFVIILIPVVYEFFIRHLKDVIK